MAENCNGNGFLDPAKERILSHLRNKENELAVQTQSMYATLARLGVAFRDSDSLDAVKYSNLPTEQSSLERYGRIISKTTSRLNISSALSPHVSVPRSTRHVHNGEATVEAIDQAQKSLHELRNKRKVGVERRVEEQRQALEAMERVHLRSIDKAKKEHAIRTSADYVRRKYSRRLLASLLRIHTSRAVLHFAAVKGDILLLRRSLRKMRGHLIIRRQLNIVGNLMGSRLTVRRLLALLRRRVEERDVALQQRVCASTFLERTQCRRAMHRLSWTTTRLREVRRSAASFEHRRCLRWGLQRLLLQSRELCRPQNLTATTLTTFLRSKRRARLQNGLRCLTRCTAGRIKMALASHTIFLKTLRQAFSAFVVSLSRAARSRRSMSLSSHYYDRSTSRKALAWWFLCVRSRRQLFAAASATLAVRRRGHRRRAVTVSALVHAMQRSRLFKRWMAWRIWAADRKAAVRRHWQTMLLRHNVNRHAVPALAAKHFAALAKCARAERHRRLRGAKLSLLAQCWWALLRSRVAQMRRRRTASDERLKKARAFFWRKRLRQLLSRLRAAAAMRRTSRAGRLHIHALAKRLQVFQRHCQAMHQQRRANYFAAECVRRARAAAALVQLQRWCARSMAAKKRHPRRPPPRVSRSLLLAALARWCEWLRGVRSAAAVYATGRAHWRRARLRTGFGALRPDHPPEAEEVEETKEESGAEEVWKALDVAGELVDDDDDEESVASASLVFSQPVQPVPIVSLPSSRPSTAPAAARTAGLPVVEPPLSRVGGGASHAPGQSLRVGLATRTVKSGAGDRTQQDVPLPAAHPRRMLIPGLPSVPPAPAPAAAAAPAGGVQLPLRPQSSRALLTASSFASTSSWASAAVSGTASRRVPDLGLRRRFRQWRRCTQAARTDRRERLRPAHHFFCHAAASRALRVWQELCARRRRDERRMADYRRDVQIPRLLGAALLQLLVRVERRRDNHESYRLAWQQAVRATARELLRDWRVRSQQSAHFRWRAADGDDHIRTRRLCTLLATWRRVCDERTARRMRSRQARQHMLRRAALAAVRRWHAHAQARATRRGRLRIATRRRLAGGWVRLRQRLLTRRQCRTRRREKVLVRGARSCGGARLRCAWRRWRRVSTRRRALRGAFLQTRAKRQLRLLRTAFVCGLAVHLRESINASVALLATARSHHTARAQRLALYRLCATLRRAKALRQRVARFRFARAAMLALRHWRRGFLASTVARGRAGLAVALAGRRRSAQRHGLAAWRDWARRRRGQATRWVLPAPSGARGAAAAHKALGDALRARGFSRVGQAVSAAVRGHRLRASLRVWLQRRHAVWQQREWRAVAHRHCDGVHLRAGLAQAARWAAACAQRRGQREALEQALHRRAAAEALGRLRARLQARDERALAAQALAHTVCVRYYLRWRSRSASAAALRHAVQRLGAAASPRVAASRGGQRKRCAAARRWHRDRRLAAALATLRRACVVRHRQSRALSALIPHRRALRLPPRAAVLAVSAWRAMQFPLRRLRLAAARGRGQRALLATARQFWRRRRLCAAVHRVVRLAQERRRTRQVHTLRTRHLFTALCTLHSRRQQLHRCLRALLQFLAQRHARAALRRWQCSAAIERRSEAVLAGVVRAQRVQALCAWREWTRRRVAHRRRHSRRSSGWRLQHMCNVDAVQRARVFARLLRRLDAVHRLRDAYRRAVRHHVDTARRLALLQLRTAHRRRAAAVRFARRCLRRWRAGLAMRRKRVHREHTRMAMACAQFLRAKLAVFACRARTLANATARRSPTGVLLAVHRQCVLRRGLRRLRSAALLRRMDSAGRAALAEWHWEVQLRTAFHRLAHKHFRIRRLRRNNALLLRLEARLVLMRALKVWDTAGVLRRWHGERLRELDATGRGLRLRAALRRWRAVAARKHLRGHLRRQRGAVEVLAQ